jgi:hypothetical protein
MKRFLIIFTSVLLLVGCTQEPSNTDITENENVSTSGVSTEDVSTGGETAEPIEAVEYQVYPDYTAEVFGDEWTSPGLVTSTGAIYVSPSPNETTGERLNVLDFGAQPDNPEFDNTESFQMAIDAANAGDEVYVPAGEYHFMTASLFNTSYVAHLALKSNVNFIGDGIGETILVSDFDANTNEKYYTAVLVSRTQSDIVISGMTITSDTDDSRMPDPDVSSFNNFVETAPVYGIVVDNDKPTEIHGNVVIENVLVERFQRMGIRIRVVRDVRVSNCIIQNATDLGGGGAGYGISIQGIANGADLTDSNLDPVHNIVENCEIYGPYIRHGILIQYSAHNNLVTNNKLYDTLLDSIDLHGEDEYANEISFNTVTNARSGAGIGLGNSGATHDATGPYNYIHDNTIIGGDRGIDIQYGTENSVIVNNVIKDIETEDATGIFMQNANNSIIRDNSFENIDGSEAYGVKLIYSYNALEPEKGIPDGIQIADNSFTNVTRGVYVDSYTENYIYEGNVFDSSGEYDYLDESALFELPEISDVVIPKYGTIMYPTDDNFITNENRTYVQTQANMKFKASYYDIPYNRMIYLKFDLTDAPDKDKVYLKISGKSKDGLVTIDIHGTTAYTDWTESSINWENALYHEDQTAKIADEDELDYVTDFTFTAVGTEFNTYYIDVTDYIKSIDEQYVTLILSNDQVQDMYCEIYSKEVSADDLKLCLIFADEE